PRRKLRSAYIEFERHVYSAAVRLALAEPDRRQGQQQAASGSEPKPSKPDCHCACLLVGATPTGARPKHQIASTSITRSRWRRGCTGSYRDHTLMFLFLRVPGEYLQVQHKYRVELRNHQQGNKGSDCQSTNLRIAERLPEWTAMQGQREKRQHGRSDGDHHRPQSNDAGIDHCFLERLAHGVTLLDEVEEHDNMTDDNA